MATVEIQVTPDCGNAPRKQVLRDFSAAVAERRTDALLSAVADDAEWDIIGRQAVRGKGELGAALESMAEPPVTALHLDSLVTHGNEGAVASRVVLDGGRRLRCCDVHRFSGHSKSAKIKRIVSYGIEE